MNQFTKAALLATSGLMLGITPAHAQSSDTAKADEGDEIIVTATLRAESVQNIPVAVTAISPAALDREGVTDIKTLSAISPSFNIQNSQTESQGTSIRIRGIGTTGNNIGLESSVGVFIDGVYQSRPGIALGDMVDLERLEVLRGPQGTLFGRNTSAGALNISTKRPDLSKIEGTASATYGNYNFVNLQGVVNLPVIQDVLGLRLAGAYRSRDGYVHSTTGATSHDRDRWLLRGQLLFEPSSDLSVRIVGDYSKATEHCCDAVVYRETELATFYNAFTAYGLPNDGVTASGPSALKDLTTNSDAFYNGQEQWGVSGEFKWDLGAVKLTWIPAYRNFTAPSIQDPDFTTLDIVNVGPGATAPFANFPYFQDDIQTHTQELRFQGKALGGRLDWLVGGYYSHEKIREVIPLSLGPDYQRAVGTLFYPALAGLGDPYLLGPNPLYTLTAIGSGGAPVDTNGSYAVNAYGQTTNSWSIFTHNVFDITDKLSLTLGARYVNETKDGYFDQLAASSPACQAVVDGALNGNFTAAGLGAYAPNIVGATCLPFATSVGVTIPSTSTLASTVLPLPREFSGRFKDDEITWTAQLAFKPNADLLIYGGASHGFKSGGFNLDSTAAAGGKDPRFASEKVNDYELGIKATLGRVNANLALFHMDISGFQVLEFTGLQFVTFNIDKAKSTGAELEVFGKLTDNLSANLSLTYADSRYPDDCAPSSLPATSPQRRVCGHPLTNAPKLSGVFSLTYDGQVGSTGWGLHLNSSASYASSRRTSFLAIDEDLTPLVDDYQKASLKLNARIGLTTPDERFTFELWGTNLTNEITRGITFNVALRGAAGARARGAWPDEPRMYGATVRMKF